RSEPRHNRRRQAFDQPGGVAAKLQSERPRARARVAVKRLPSAVIAGIGIFKIENAPPSSSCRRKGDRRIELICPRRSDYLKAQPYAHSAPCSHKDCTTSAPQSKIVLFISRNECDFHHICRKSPLPTRQHRRGDRRIHFSAPTGSTICAKAAAIRRAPP